MDVSGYRNSYVQILQKMRQILLADSDYIYMTEHALTCAWAIARGAAQRVDLVAIIYIALGRQSLPSLPLVRHAAVRHPGTMAPTLRIRRP